MTTYHKIQSVIAEYGVTRGYKLVHLPAGNWRLTMPKQKAIYGSCARAIIPAIRRRFRKRRRASA